MATADLILRKYVSFTHRPSAMRVVLFVFGLLAAVASTKGCSSPRCEMGQRYCSETSKDSGQVNITCSSNGKRILEEKDWVAPGAPIPDSCGCSLLGLSLHMFVGDTPGEK